MSSDVDLLLAEYKANVDLWKHDDDLRQKRTATFLTVNLFLFGIVAFVVKEAAIAKAGIVVATFFAGAFGVLTSAIWLVILLRSHQYLSFRRRQLAEIEAKLGTVNTFTNQYRAITRGEPLQFLHSEGGSFKVPWIATISSSTLEALLPPAMIFIWIAIASFVIATADYSANKKQSAQQQNTTATQSKP